MVSEVVYSALAAIVTFNVMPESHIDTIGAGVVALILLVWRMKTKGTDQTAFFSLLRKVIQSVAPIGVLFGWLTAEQATGLMGIALAAVGSWTFLENKDQNLQSGTPPTPPTPPTD